MLAHMMNMYIQQTVLAAKPSHIKVPCQVSLIDCLVFKQQKRIGHPQKKDIIDKEIYQTPSYGSDIPSETYPSPISHSETSRIYLIPFPLLLFLLF